MYNLSTFLLFLQREIKNEKLKFKFRKLKMVLQAVKSKNSVQDKLSVTFFILNNRVETCFAENKFIPLETSTTFIEEGSHLIATNICPVATNTLPFATNTLPIETNTRLIETNTRPIATNTRPVATNTRPVDAGMTFASSGQIIMHYKSIN